MEFWYSDKHTKEVQLSMKIKHQIVSHESDFQQIDILETYEYGKVLVLDGELMITEKDEFIYHEMISHVSMAVHPHVENVLVIGGGDGGTVRELAKYKTIHHIDLVEVDEDLVNLCKKHFPTTALMMEDERVYIYHEEGLRFVRSRQEEYDLIIVDCADPFGPAEGLFTREFYGNCYKALRKDGILINQHESPFYSEHSQTVQKAHKHITAVFPLSTVYQCHIPSYPSGHWLFGFASKHYDPIRDLNAEKWNALEIPTHYYNTDLHKGSFYLPNYVKELLGTNE
ncbi:polyamine aminopropyltransferase [Anaeromicropila populeti]|uniref:Polyamine aminopropyltransferase n=1 Tax=Anaeromicropila populeti TaxID=37658 RepID=A0A1I6LUV1_9FIRM|nr:polyamine aminopropyltransferase [Anaeromicropila populeti]SFS07150.1 spermidine synthase [Anaeromicropila populeti]